MGTKKFFSLLYGDQLRVAPQTKVIPADQLSKLLDSEEILKTVKDEAHRYKKEVASSTESVKEAAQQEGFETGFAEWAEHIAGLEEAIDRTNKRIEEIAIPLALKAAKKIVGHQLQVDPNTTVQIVANNLNAVSQHKEIVIWVNKQDLSLIEKSKPQLAEIFEALKSLSVREREDVEPGGCIIETEGGIINAQLSNKWEALEQAFESMLRGKGVSDEDSHH